MTSSRHRTSKQHSLRYKGVIAAIDRSRVHEIIRQSVLEVKTEDTFQEAWPGEEPSWVTAPRVLLLKLSGQRMEVVDCDMPVDKIKPSRTSADLLLALGDDSLEDEEPSHIPEHFMKMSSSRHVVPLDYHPTGSNWGAYGQGERGSVNP